MFYKLGAFSGRLEATSQFKAYNPQGFSPAAASSSEQVFALKSTKSSITPAAFVTGTRQQATASTQRMAATDPIITGKGFPKIRQLQALFKEQHNMPVYLIGGPKDRLMFFASIGLCTVGLGIFFSSIYTLSFPKKPIPVFQIADLLCLALTASAMTFSTVPSISSFWIIIGYSFYAFQFLVAFWCFMTSLVILLASGLSEMTAIQLPQTFFFLCYHVIAAFFNGVGTATLFIQGAKYSYVLEKINYANTEYNIKSLVFVGGAVGGVACGFYVIISILSFGKYIQSRNNSS